MIKAVGVSTDVDLSAVVPAVTAAVRTTLLAVGTRIASDVVEKRAPTTTAAFVALDAINTAAAIVSVF